MSLHIICRLCLKVIRDSEYYDLTTDRCENPSSKASSLKNKITMYLPEVNMKIRLKYPMVICTDCMKIIEVFHIFKRKCKETEKLLHKYICSRPREYIENELINLVEVSTYLGLSGFNNARSSPDVKPLFLLPNSNGDKGRVFDSFPQWCSGKNLSNTPEGCGSVDGCNADQGGFLNIDPSYLKMENTEHDDLHNLPFEEAFNDQYHFKKYNRATNYSGALLDLSSSQLLCLICNKFISTKHKLRTHFYRNHMKKPRSNCKVCFKSFRDKYGLTIHMRVHTGERPYQCEICHKRFTTSLTYKNHKSLHKDKRPFPCTICNKSFVNISELKRHTNSVHSLQKEKESYECDVCFQKLCSKANLRQHKLKHVDNRPFECDICFQRFIGLNFLNSHKSSKHAEYKEKGFTCNICCKTFSSKERLIKHMFIHKRAKSSAIENSLEDKEHMSGENYFQCNSCSKTYTRKYNLEKHINLSHDETAKNTCSRCQKRFATTTLLSKHQCIQDDEKKYECDICDKRFFTRASLKLHYRAHSEEQPFQCDVCGNTFNDKGTLVRHILTHSDEKPYACELCPKRYSTKLSLNAHKLYHTDGYTVKCFVCSKQVNKNHIKIHLQIHTGEKPFECKVCLKRFITRRHLRRHMIVHTKEKPFKCNICFKHYTTLDVLKIHQRIHSGEKPFQCDICGSFFSEKNSVRKHRERKHNNMRFECDICLERFSTRVAWKTHKLIHNPLECDICKKQFISLGRLNSHKKIHNDDKPHACDVCQKRFRHAIHLQKHKRILPLEKSRECKICKVRFTYSCETILHKKCNGS